MDVRIDQPGAIDGAVCIKLFDLPWSLGMRVTAHRCDFAINNEKVAVRVRTAGWIDDPAVCDQQGIHEKIAVFC